MFCHCNWYCCYISWLSFSWGSNKVLVGICIQFCFSMIMQCKFLFPSQYTVFVIYQYLMFWIARMIIIFILFNLQWRFYVWFKSTLAQESNLKGFPCFLQLVTENISLLESRGWTTLRLKPFLLGNLSLNMMSFDNIKFINIYFFSSNFWRILSKNLHGYREKELLEI